MYILFGKGKYKKALQNKSIRIIKNKDYDTIITSYTSHFNHKLNTHTLQKQPTYVYTYLIVHMHIRNLFVS